jgi:hypothetical protein
MAEDFGSTGGGYDDVNRTVAVAMRDQSRMTGLPAGAAK